MSKARLYKQSHLKMLFALSGNECAMTDCKRNLVAKDATLVGKICHIEAASEGGPRWNRFMDDDERRHFSNLIIMCSEHHDVIDNRENENIYTVSKLKEMKSEHEERNRTHQFELKKHHLEQLSDQLNNISSIILDTNREVKGANNQLKLIDEKIKTTLFLFEKFAVNISSRNTPNDQDEITSFVTMSQGYDWLSLKQFTFFQKVIAKYNENILDQRRSFIYCQNMIQAIFEITSLKEIINSWNKNSLNPENLDHLRFIQCGVMAYECLESIPKGVMDNIRLHNHCPIYHSYFNGHLGSFIFELKYCIKTNVNLVDRYKSDRYLFENLTRIFSSLRNFLEIDADEIYPSKKEAKIIEQLPDKFLVLSTSNEITVRDHNDCNKILAKLPLKRQFKVTKTEIVRQGSETKFICFNAQCCFYWNPEKDLVETIFFQVEKEDEVTDIFCELNSLGKILCVVQQGKKLIQFIDFKEDRSVTLKETLNLARHNNGFVGMPTNYLNSSGPLLFSVDENFNLEAILTVENLRAEVEHDKNILQWMASFSGRRTPVKGITDILQDIRVQSLSHNVKNIILVTGKINFSSVLIFLELTENELKYIKVYLLEKSVSITIDSLSSDTLDLCCGYLNMNDNNSSFEYLKLKNFEVISSESRMNPEKCDLQVTDIYQVCFGNKDVIYLNENGNKLFKHSLPENSFYEYLMPEDEFINNIKFYSNDYYS